MGEIKAKIKCKSDLDQEFSHEEWIEKCNQTETISISVRYQMFIFNVIHRICMTTESMRKANSDNDDTYIKCDLKSSLSMCDRTQNIQQL